MKAGITNLVMIGWSAGTAVITAVVMMIMMSVSSGRDNLTHEVRAAGAVDGGILMTGDQGSCHHRIEGLGRDGGNRRRTCSSNTRRHVDPRGVHVRDQAAEFFQCVGLNIFVAVSVCEREQRLSKSLRRGKGM